MESLVNIPSKERYREKPQFIGGKDPYEIPKETWKDDVDLWPSVTYINVGMYIPSFFAKPVQWSMMNYKSLECYQRCWVRDILVVLEGEKSAKVTRG